MKVLLRGGVAVPSAESVFTVERSLPHGHVAAVLGAARGSGSSAWFGSAPQDLQLVLQAMLVARLLEPASKLATHRMLHDDTATSSLGRVLGVGQCSADDLYRALDWLHEAQAGIERRLARQHLVGSTLVLYDLTSTWLTGRSCELAARGHSRDGKRDDPQSVLGLVCTAEGCPISVEVFKGNTADPATVATQVAKLKERFGVVMQRVQQRRERQNRQINERLKTLIAASAAGGRGNAARAGETEPVVAAAVRGRRHGHRWPSGHGGRPAGAGLGCAARAGRATAIGLGNWQSSGSIEGRTLRPDDSKTAQASARQHAPNAASPCRARGAG
ncbi:MAG: hypothetical protein IH627_00500 [Rubrivivax sp.]|nr:hypothetical protein [Rubrivivax sp.]